MKEDGMGLPGSMTIIRAGSAVQASPEGISSAPFQVEMLLSGSADGALTAMRAMLDPGVVIHWHTHPHGQLLLAVSGVGLVQRRGGQVTRIGPGDAVWFAPGEEHWHGATGKAAFIYVSIQAMQDGSAVCWLEPVTRHNDDLIGRTDNVCNAI